jgi:ribose transport system substrate-binding protein
LTARAEHITLALLPTIIEDGIMPRWGYIGLALVASLALTGCGGSSDYKYRVVVIPKGLTHEHWQSVHRGADRAAADLAAQGIKVEVLWQGPQTESDALEQIGIVDRSIGRKVSGIVLAPQNSQQMVKPVARARADGIPTVIIDSNLDKDELKTDPDLTVKYVATDNRRGGWLAGDHLLKVLAAAGKKSPRLVLFRYATGSESTEERERGFLDRINEERAKGEPGPEIIADNDYAGSTVESAEKAAGPMLTRLQAKGAIDGIFAVNESSATGLLNALRSAGLNKQVHVVAFDISAPLRRAIEEDEVDGTIVQDPYRMGYLGVWYLVQYREGYDAASDGKKDVSTGEYLVTKDNIKTKEIEGLFTPAVQKERKIETPELKKKG